MHTETTLHHFDNSTTRLGHLFQKFQHGVCSKFHTYDLPHETAARAQRQHLRAVNQKGKQRADEASSDGHSTKQRSFNMSTYKLHSLGDYVKSIWLFGMTDNYSTQIICFLPVPSVSGYYLPLLTSLQGELEHRRVKRLYTRTNKIKFTRGIAMQQRHERLLHRLQDIEHETSVSETHDNENQPFLHFINQEPLSYCSAKDHYQMSSSQKHYWDISAWFHKNWNDIAIKAGPWVHSIQKGVFLLLISLEFFASPKNSYSSTTIWTRVQWR